MADQDASHAEDPESKIVRELSDLCNCASECDESSWDAVRKWLRGHSAEEAQKAMGHRGVNGRTPLHLACRKCPPIDIVIMLLTALPEAATHRDALWRLPLHNACLCGASDEVLAMLDNSYPESKTVADKRQRMPLHYALDLNGGKSMVSVETIKWLSHPEAVLQRDVNGMLPLHVACAYGASQEVLHLLVQNNAETISSTDLHERTPLHFALGNADHPKSPGVVSFLLDANPEMVNMADKDGTIPLELLADRACVTYGSKQREKCGECLSLYLEAKPQATEKLCSALQSLPKWLQEFLSYRNRKLAELWFLCESIPQDHDPSSWDAVREWLRTHSRKLARQAAEYRGEHDTTPLHMVCRNCAPIDIVVMLLKASPETIRYSDSCDWLPLHYASACRCSEEVLIVLAAKYPEGKVAMDTKGRVPLHYALDLSGMKSPSTITTIKLLSGNGAVLIRDELGMLPLHYASAYGATVDTLHTITKNNTKIFFSADNHGRTPLHFALGNADRQSSIGVVRYLLAQNSSVINIPDNQGNLPINMLAKCAHLIKENEREQRTRCEECLSLCLDANPQATADLVITLQSLPNWLRDFAVASPVVQKLLNAKVSQRFPTAVMLMDFAFLVMVVVFFGLAVEQSLKARYSNQFIDDSNTNFLIPLYSAAFYFTMREIAQAMSLVSLGLFDTWKNDLTNWFDVLYIILILFWATEMELITMSTHHFQTGATLSLGLFWINIILFLKAFFVGFAVFVGGLVYVARRFLTALIALLIIMAAFAQMFHTVFRQTSQCHNGSSVSALKYISWPTEKIFCDNTGCITETPDSCEPSNDNPWCNFWTSLLKVCTMLLGEVDDDDFGTSTLAILLFALFMFGVVIIMANILIAIVTDSYSVIKNERAATTFWSNRLYFVAEMDVIYNGFCRWRRYDKELASKGILWSRLMDLINDQFNDHGVDYGDDIFAPSFFERLLILCLSYIFITTWILFGLVTFGLLWPPQIREWLLTVQFKTRTRVTGEERVNQIEDIRRDVSVFRSEMNVDLDRVRDDIGKFRRNFNISKSEIKSEIKSMQLMMNEILEEFESSVFSE